MTHTIHVAQLSRAIARSLHLNEDLAEAIALGHDTGHPPFGHRGEKVLDELSQQYLGKPFLHNIHSLRMLDVLERNGNGLNLSYEVREGIIRHCGEVTTGNFMTGEALDNLEEKPDAEPSTLEGCVVKICDRIAYVGKDIEDATTSGIIQPGDIPEKIAAVLGDDNGHIIDALVRDLVMNFYMDREAFSRENHREPDRREIGIRLSEPVLNALNSLINDFNYPRIYMNDTNNTYSAQTENMVRGLFRHFLEELDNMQVKENSQSTLMHFNGEMENPLANHPLGQLERMEPSHDLTRARRFIVYDNLKDFQSSRSSILYFLEEMEEEYWLNTRNAQIVIDYITFMTDTMAMAIFESLTIPRPIV
jgi:dGTP triphosphohydrolase